MGRITDLLHVPQELSIPTRQQSFASSSALERNRMERSYNNILYQMPLIFRGL